MMMMVLMVKRDGVNDGANNDEDGDDCVDDDDDGDNAMRMLLTNQGSFVNPAHWGWWRW